MEAIYLRSLELADLDRTHRWHNDPSLYESLGGTFRHVSRAAEEEWLRKTSGYSPREVNLAICLSGNDEHIGNVYLKDIDWVSRRAELHIFIGDPAQRGKGYGFAATRLLLRHAFQDLGLQRVYLHVLHDNAAAVRVYEKCGFAVEGRLRKHVFKQGRWQDVIVMGICADDRVPDEV